MQTVGLLFILGAIFIGREVMVGRAKETPTDLRDLFSGFLNADMSSVQEVLARRGSNTEAGTADPGTGVDGSPVAVSASSGSTDTGLELAREVVTLGSAASGYVLGATGPQAYDCSGLVWKACKTIGIYVGARFTTGTFEHIAETFCKRVTSPAAGDIVVWVSKGHMGVMVSNSLFYSARSPEKGIGSAPLSADVAYFGGQPDIWRPNGSPSKAPTTGGTQL
jgi:hypothetical protein